MTRQVHQTTPAKLASQTRNLCYAHGQNKMRVFLRVIKYAEFSGKKIRSISQTFTELCSFDASIHETTPAKLASQTRNLCYAHGQNKMRVFLRVIKYAEFSGKKIRSISQTFTELCSFDASIHETTSQTCQPNQEPVLRTWSK